VLACLRSKSGEEIIAQTFPNVTTAVIYSHNCILTLFSKNFTGLPDLLFGPRIDVERQPSFIPGHPRILLETGQFNHVPFVTGVNQNEGAMVAASTFSSNFPPSLLIE
jgi:Carboxylesterase family